jgi:hypothetical protein
MGEGPRRFRGREERWAAVEVVEGRLISAFEKQRADVNTAPVRLAAGFGGRRV